MTVRMMLRRFTIAGRVAPLLALVALVVLAAFLLDFLDLALSPSLVISGRLEEVAIRGGGDDRRLSRKTILTPGAVCLDDWIL